MSDACILVYRHRDPGTIGFVYNKLGTPRGFVERVEGDCGAKIALDSMERQYGTLEYNGGSIRVEIEGGGIANSQQDVCDYAVKVAADRLYTLEARKTRFAPAYEINGHALDRDKMKLMGLVCSDKFQESDQEFERKVGGLARAASGLLCPFHPASLMLDLSTAHMPSHLPEFGPLRATETEHGFVVFVQGGTFADEIELPGWIAPAHGMAVDCGALLINYDSSAPVYAALPTWDW